MAQEVEPGAVEQAWSCHNTTIRESNMSRIGKKIIPIPKGVAITIEGSNVKVKGPKGELSYAFNPDLTIKQEDGNLSVARPSDERQHRALHGTTRALINNMVIGVSEGFSRELEIRGVGYRAEVSGTDLVLALGYSHPIRVPAPANVSFDVPKESKGTQIIIKGIDKQVVGELAAYIRGRRPPEPYLGKGVRYKGEFVRAKAGKAGKGKKK
jgi:large subunit ribosomal protein L6